MGTVVNDDFKEDRFKNKYSLENPNVDDDIKKVRLISGIGKKEALSALLIRDELVKILSKNSNQMDMEEYSDGELTVAVQELISRVKQMTGYKRGRDDDENITGNVNNTTEMSGNSNMEENTELKKSSEISSNNSGIVETNNSEDDDTMKLPPLKKMKLNSFIPNPSTNPPPPDIPPV